MKEYLEIFLKIGIYQTAFFEKIFNLAVEYQIYY